MKLQAWKKQLLDEFYSHRDQLITCGAGVSLVQRALAPQAIVSEIEKREQAMGREQIKELVIKLLARYIVLIQENNHFFDYTAANEPSRALLNNGIEDKDLTWWCHFERSYGEKESAYRPVPPALQAEIDSILASRPAN